MTWRENAILAAMRLNLEEIRNIAEMVQEKGLEQVVVESTEADVPACRLQIRRFVPLATPAAEEALVAEQAVQPLTIPTLVITSPTVGIFRYGGSGLKVGQPVKERQIVGLVESLKVPNEVRASSGGVISSVLAQDGQGVEFGQPLLELHTDT